MRQYGLFKGKAAAFTDAFQPLWEQYGGRVVAARDAKVVFGRDERVLDIKASAGSLFRGIVAYALTKHPTIVAAFVGAGGQVVQDMDRAVMVLCDMDTQGASREVQAARAADVEVVDALWVLLSSRGQGHANLKLGTADA